MTLLCASTQEILPFGGNLPLGVFELSTDAIPTYSDHPGLSGLLVLAVLCAAVGVVAWQFVGGRAAVVFLALAVLLAVSVYAKVFVILVRAYPDHPMLFSLLAIAVHFAAVGVAVEQVLGNDVAGAFFVIYGIIAAFLGGGGYAILIAARLVSRARRRVEPM